MTGKKRLGAVIFPGFELLDLFGPLQMFGLLSDSYALELVAQTAGPVVSNKGVCAEAACALADAGPYDLLLVPGGKGTRREVDNPALVAWIADRAPRAELVMSVCTGAALLARAGVLDGRRATTNKAAFGWVASQGSAVDWVPEARWVEDGPVFSSSGVSAGMDMALGAIAHLQGTETAQKVAHWCEYTWHSDKDHDPFAALHGLI